MLKQENKDVISATKHLFYALHLTQMMSFWYVILKYIAPK